MFDVYLLVMVEEVTAKTVQEVNNNGALSVFCQLSTVPFERRLGALFVWVIKCIDMFPRDPAVHAFRACCLPAGLSITVL